MKRILLALVLVAAFEDDAIFPPAKHDAATLRAFVAHHGAAQVEAYFDKKRRFAPTDFDVPDKVPGLRGSPRSSLVVQKKGRPKTLKEVPGMNDATFSYGHWRWAALGPVLQCPPAIFTSFGTARESLSSLDNALDA